MAPSKNVQDATEANALEKDRKTKDHVGSDLDTDDEECDEDYDEDDDEEYYDDDEDGIDDDSSEFSTVSQDSLPPIREFGHTYHGSGRLFLPIDEVESRRLVIQHNLYKACLDGRLAATSIPLKPRALPPSPAVASSGVPSLPYTGSSTDSSSSGGGGGGGGGGPRRFQILDAGAGNGIWSIEMAQMYPQADVLGIDLSSALLPEDVPPNLTFEIADLEEPWPRHRQFDFIHMRNLVGGGVRDWRALIRSAFAQLRPGGQLEFSEVRPHFYDGDPNLMGPEAEAEAETGDLLLPTPASDPTPTPGQQVPSMGKATHEYGQRFAQVCRQLELDFDPLPQMPMWLAEVGAVSVKTVADFMPSRSWGRDQKMRKKGELMTLAMENGEFSFFNPIYTLHITFPGHTSPFILSCSLPFLFRIWF